MNNKFEEEIFSLGPILYQRKTLSINQTCLAWGIECPDSWYNELKDLTIKLEKLNNQYKDLIQVVAEQVKEKYGSLHFYYDIVTIKDNIKQEIINDISQKCNEYIENAEENLWNVCYICGEIATQTSNGWIERYCDNCFKNINDGK